MNMKKKRRKKEEEMSKDKRRKDQAGSGGIKVSHAALRSVSAWREQDR